MMKKVFAILGMIVALWFSVLGFMTVDGEFGYSMSYPTIPSSYDSGYATFGGDYYTYSVNNSAAAGYGSLAAAENTANLARSLETILGYAMMCIGLLAFCAFGVILCSGKKKPTCVVSPCASPVAAEPTAPIEEPAEEMEEPAEAPMEEPAEEPADAE